MEEGKGKGPWENNLGQGMKNRCAGRQGPYLRSLEHLGRSSEKKKV